MKKLSVKEAAELMKVKEDTVLDYIHTGDLEVEKEGGEYIIPEEELNLLQQRKEKGILFKQQHRCKGE